MTHADDRILLRLTHRGDDHAARLLWARWGGLLRAYTRSIVPHAADDIVQRALCRMMQCHGRDIAAVEDVRAWLVTLARREAISYRRAERRSHTRDLRPRPARDAAQDTSGLDAALGSLPRVLREVVTLRHASGMTFEQIADALGANRHTIAWRYTRGLELLRHRMCPSVHSEPTEVVHAAR